MNSKSYFYKCSPKSIDSIATDLYSQILETIELLPARSLQSDIEFDLFWLLTSVGWQYDTVPTGISKSSPDCFEFDCTLEELESQKDRKACLTSTTLGSQRCADYAKQFDAGLVQIEVQFGALGAMFKDYCGFRIAYAEKRLALGVEIVLNDPTALTAQIEKPDTELANFEVAKQTLDTIGLDCPIWLLGIEM